MKKYCILGLLAMVNLAACTASSTRSTDRSAAAVAGQATDSTALAQQLADAMALVDHKDWPQAQAALSAVIEAKTFSTLPSDVQYRALWTAGRVFADHEQLKRGYDYLVRVVATPQSTFEDGMTQLRAAASLGYKSDAADVLTGIVQRYPDRIANIKTDWIWAILREARQLPHSQRLALLRALYAARWKSEWNFEPSSAWLALTLLLLENGALTEAIDVSAHVTDVYDLIAMRVDRRFDAIVAANPSQFDIDAAVSRELRQAQSASEEAPRSLALKLYVIDALRNHQHYDAMLAATDSLIVDLRSTNFPEHLYDDYDKWHAWVLNERENALERVGRWDEAVAQLSAASLIPEDGQGNVSQLINLGQLYCDLGRPTEALQVIGTLVGKTSPYGDMQREIVRLDAASQLGDGTLVARSLQTMEAHKADAQITYEQALIIVKQPDRAAQFLIERLQNVDQREAALLSVQTYGSGFKTARQTELDARWRAVIARKDVQAAIQKVGRMESYHVEAQLQ